MSQFYSYNGKIYQEGDNFISPGSRAFRYGDGLFETMVVRNGNIRLSSYHFERLFEGMQLMKFEIPALFSPAYLMEEILAICKKNK